MPWILLENKLRNLFGTPEMMHRRIDDGDLPIDNNCVENQGRRGLKALLTSATSIRCQGRGAATGSRLARSGHRRYRRWQCAG